MSIVRRTTTKLDGEYLVLELLEYDDKTCLAQVPGMTLTCKACGDDDRVIDAR